MQWKENAGIAQIRISWRSYIYLNSCIMSLRREAGRRSYNCPCEEENMSTENLSEVSFDSQKRSKLEQITG